MNILYFHQYFCTPKGSGGTRSYEFARRWVKAGHNVHIVSGRGYDATLSDAPRQVRVEGISVDLLGVRYAASMSFGQRLQSFLRYAAQSTWLAGRARWADVVLATSSPLTVAIPGLVARRWAKRPMVFEVRDVWPDAAIDAGILKNPLLIYLARRLEMAAYRGANRIVALSTGMADRIQSKVDVRSRMAMIPNSSDLELFGDAQRTRAEKRAEMQAGDRMIVIYSGAINLANDIEHLVEVMTLLRHQTDIQWWFVGGGNREHYLRAEIERRGLKQCRLLGKIPKAELPRLLGAADVGVVSFIDQPVYFENSPNKFFDYCAAGLPSMFNRTTWLEPYLAREGAGWVIRSHRAQEMAGELARLRNHPEERAAAGRAARRLAEQEFSREVLSERYLQLLIEVAGEAGPVQR